MTTKEYWEQREKAHAAETKKSEDELAKRLRDRLDALQVEMDKQIHGFYSRYAKAEGITMAEAQQRVAEMDVKAFEAKAKKYVETRDFSDQANAELRLYNATMRINRLELLKAEMGLEMVDAFNDIQSMTGEGLTQRTLDEIARQAGILKSNPDNMLGQVDDIVNGSLNNAKWSERIWMYQNQMKNVVSDMLTNGIIQGKNPRDLARELSRTFGSTKYDAERLMRTEMNRVQTEAQIASFKENGYEQFMFISTEDAHTCSVCAEMNGQIFDVKDYAAGDNAPPMHPNCRCSTAAHMDMDAVYKEVFGEGATELPKAAFSSISNQRGDYDPNAMFDIEIDGIPENVKKKIDSLCKDVIKKGNIDGNEHGYTIDLISGEVKYYTSGMQGDIFGKEFFDYIADKPKNSIIAIHNHADNRGYSYTDINTSVSCPQIRSSIIACHNGNSYTLSHCIKTFETGSSFTEADLFEDIVKALRNDLITGKIMTNEFSSLKEELCCKRMAETYFENYQEKIK